MEFVDLEACCCESWYLKIDSSIRQHTRTGSIGGARTTDIVRHAATKTRTGHVVRLRARGAFVVTDKTADGRAWPNLYTESCTCQSRRKLWLSTSAISTRSVERHVDVLSLAEWQASKLFPCRRSNITNSSPTWCWNGSTVTIRFVHLAQFTALSRYGKRRRRTMALRRRTRLCKRSMARIGRRLVFPKKRYVGSQRRRTSSQRLEVLSHQLDIASVRLDVR